MPTNLYDDSEFIKLRDLAHRLEVEVEVLKARGEAAKEALALASEALIAYKASNNEWGHSLRDAQSQINQYMTTNTADAKFEKEESARTAISDRVNSLEKNRNELSGRSTGADTTRTLLITLAFLTLAVLTFLGFRLPAK
jgi:chromosome segregation ATPase